MTFKDYLKQELQKAPPDFYDPEGNSARAIVSRGVWKEIVRCYKEYPRVLKEHFSDFDGLDTPLSWVVTTTLVLCLLPLVPVFVGVSEYRDAIKQYRFDYDSLVFKDGEVVDD